MSDKSCFILCPIGAEKSSDRERSDLLLKHVFQPVLSEIGYSALRADQIPKAGLITSQIINLIMDSDLVIADLTGGNPNVFYELAIRHATAKPYIQIIEAGASIPFDISGVRTIQIDSKHLDSVQAAKFSIKDQIQQFEKGHRADSPISVAANVRLLQSDSSYAELIVEKFDELRGFGWTNLDELGDKLDDVARRLEEIEEKLSDP
ncbi:hypothetical protein [Salinisphaera orenii]|uniref:hypothetical protein n=1 Tax=Salinisphaera orenii TaxID=856731 RepID=UPI0016228945|nr:hypothetical protein [Salinisphaera orenii]